MTKADKRRQLIEYIKSGNISDEDRNFLLRYLILHYQTEDEVFGMFDCITMLNDIRNLGEDMACSDDTPLIRKRLLKISELTGRIAKVLETGNSEELLDISYELDKLYETSGLESRKTDTVYLKASKELNKGVKYER